MKSYISFILVSIAIVVVIGIFDFIKISNLESAVLTEYKDEKIYDGILFDAYYCPWYSAYQIKFSFIDYSCNNVFDASYVVDIVDKVKENNLSCAEAIEEFYKDKEYIYYFSCIKSESVIVKYDNGAEETVKSALKAGRISIGDLDNFGIEYFKERR